MATINYRRSGLIRTGITMIRKGYAIADAQKKARLIARRERTTAITSRVRSQTRGAYALQNQRLLSKHTQTGQKRRTHLAQTARMRRQLGQFHKPPHVTKSPSVMITRTRRSTSRLGIWHRSKALAATRRLPRRLSMKPVGS